jgi:hypothetical protein
MARRDPYELPQLAPLAGTSGALPPDVLATETISYLVTVGLPGKDARRGDDTFA